MAKNGDKLKQLGKTVDSMAKRAQSQQKVAQEIKEKTKRKPKKG